MVANAKLRHYTAEGREKATARAMEVGYRVASVELGIPWGTLSCWVFKARKAEPSADRDAAPQSPVVAETVSAAEAARPVAGPSSNAVAPSAPTTAPRPTARPRVAKVYTPSQIAQALERVAAIGVRPAAKELGISRNALRDWERKAAKAAKGEGPAPTSGPDPKAVEERRDAAILGEWRKQQGLGPSQIRNQLRRAGIKVSVQTVRRVMEGAGYRPPKVERREHAGTYEAVRPNTLWMQPGSSVLRVAGVRRAGPRSGRSGHAVHDRDGLVADLDPLHERADDVALLVPGGAVEAVGELLAEPLHVGDDARELDRFVQALRSTLQLLLGPVEALSQPFATLGQLGQLDDARLVGIHEPAQAALGSRDGLLGELVLLA